MGTDRSGASGIPLETLDDFDFASLANRLCGGMGGVDVYFETISPIEAQSIEPLIASNIEEATALLTGVTRAGDFALRVGLAGVGIAKYYLDIVVPRTVFVSSRSVIGFHQVHFQIIYANPGEIDLHTEVDAKILYKSAVPIMVRRCRLVMHLAKLAILAPGRHADVVPLVIHAIDFAITKVRKDAAVGVAVLLFPTLTFLANSILASASVAVGAIGDVDATTRAIALLAGSANRPVVVVVATVGTAGAAATFALAGVIASAHIRPLAGVAAILLLRATPPTSNALGLSDSAGALIATLTPNAPKTLSRTDLSLGAAETATLAILLPRRALPLTTTWVPAVGNLVVLHSVLGIAPIVGAGVVVVSIHRLTGTE